MSIKINLKRFLHTIFSFRNSLFAILTRHPHCVTIAAFLIRL